MCGGRTHSGLVASVPADVLQGEVQRRVQKLLQDALMSLL